MSAPLSPKQCAEMILAARRIAALTGAGISTAAGIPDFRSPEGVYASGRYAANVFDLEAFDADPREFYRFTRDLLALAGRLEPTFTHRFLANLEAEGRLAGLVTQNIDPLHRMAGSRRIIAMHGDYATSRCRLCNRVYSLEQLTSLLDSSDEPPRCVCGGVLKPAVVFFGEAVEGMDEAMDLVSGCDLLLVLGSSLQVYPAAWLPDCTEATTVIVARDCTGIPGGPGRHLVEAELDDYFRQVAAASGVGQGNG